MRRAVKIALLLLLILTCLPKVSGQDSLIVPMKSDRTVRSPHRATMLAAALPGMGQVYNRKYWKIPVVYAGFVGLGYSMWFNSSNFNKFTVAYQDFTDLIPETDSYLQVSGTLNPESFDPVLHPSTFKPSEEQWVKEQLISRVDYYRKYRDLTYIGIAAWYLISILDANVDASLSDYEVGRNLNLSINPATMPTFAGNVLAFNVRLVKTF